MDNFNIIMFVCNWGPHAAFQALQDAGSDIPPQVRMVRIPCTGRISKSLLFKAFEMGADGVALVGCEPGSCRYGTGTASAEFNVDDTRGILELLGLDQTRLRWATFLPEESSALLGFLQDFQKDLRAIGRNPVHLAAKADVPRQVLVRGSESGTVAGAELSRRGGSDLTPAVDGVPRCLCVPGLREMLLGLPAHPCRQVLFPARHGQCHYRRRQ